MKPMNLDVQSVAIEAIVPHRGRMLMVNRLLARDEDMVVVEAVVAADNVFAEDRGVPAWVGIEFMAQAISAMPVTSRSARAFASRRDAICSATMAWGCSPAKSSKATRNLRVRRFRSSSLPIQRPSWKERPYEQKYCPGHRRQSRNRALHRVAPGQGWP
jgi:hypothetical protein